MNHASPAPAPPAVGARRRRGSLRKIVVATPIALAALAVAAYLLAIEHTSLPASPRAPEPLPAELDVRLSADPAVPLAVTLEAEVSLEGHRVLPGRLAVRRNGTAKVRAPRFELYLADDLSGPAATVVVTPILGGRNEIAKLIADDLASHGMNAVIVDRNRNADVTSLQAWEDELRDAVSDRRRVVDWLITRPEVDSDRLAAYGVSYGGIITATLAAAEPRLEACVSVMAGGPLRAVIPRSVEGECRKLARAHGVGTPPTPAQLAAFEAEAEPILRTCPWTLAPYADPTKILLVTTRRDTSVPSALQERLRDALGQPETYSLPTGHYSAIAYLPVILNRARAFLRARLDRRR